MTRPNPRGSLLNLDATRPAVDPVDAATLVLLRDGVRGLEVFCVERNRNTRFMGGALVFPGGKVDRGDYDPAWNSLVTAPGRREWVAGEPQETRRAFALAACRESLEEAAILPVTGTLTHEDALALRRELATGPEALRLALAGRRLAIDLGPLVPFARWITPAAEARRYDTHFFMMRTPADQEGAHDDHETMASFWATPRDVLARWNAGEFQMAPPTHHTLVSLARSANVEDALAQAAPRTLEPVCPVLVDQDDTIALVLPGDPEHPQRERLIDGGTRYVLRDEQWRPEDAPVGP